MGSGVREGFQRLEELLPRLQDVAPRRTGGDDARAVPPDPEWGSEQPPSESERAA